VVSSFRHSSAALHLQNSAAAAAAPRVSACSGAFTVALDQGHDVTAANVTPSATVVRSTVLEGSRLTYPYSTASRAGGSRGRTAF